MPYVDRNGEPRLYYEGHGRGTPILAVAGLGSDCGMWQPAIASWAADNRVVVFDNRDAGRSSSASQAYEVLEMAADALAVADAAGVDRFHLVGVSLGGAIAQRVAIMSPARVRSLTLGVTWASDGPWRRDRGRAPFYANARRAAVIRQALVPGSAPQSPDAFSRQLAASVSHDARRDLPALPMPVQILGAQRDSLVPVAQSHDLAALLPRAGLTILDCDHSIERDPRFHDAVSTFIRLADRERRHATAR
jgi:pimeloyl-ACP methyl ester carboxylesterase